MIENFKPSDLPTKNNEVKEDPFKIPDVKDLPPIDPPESKSKFWSDIGKDIGSIPDVEELPPLEKSDDYVTIEFTDADIDPDNDELGRAYYLPKDGTWEGERGDSVWYPDRDKIPEKWQSNKDGEKNPLTWGEILDKYGIEGIPFKDGDPDFSEVTIDEVKIDDFTTERRKNFPQADEKLAEKWTAEQKDGKEWTPRDVANWRKDNDCTWHECSDMKTMQLVPREVHNNIPHAGGISEAKKQEKIN